MSMNVLLVEDNPAEARLTQEALHETGLQHELTIVTDGEMATDYLRRQNGFANARAPNLVLLDLNLPRKNGREVLREMKADPTLCVIPVIVVSNSTLPEDIEAVYRLNGNSYLCKSGTIDEFFSAIESLVDFWCRRAQLPFLSSSSLNLQPRT
jgi:two-component system, chemotaxis family, response regulator Rcp1